jgi:hypothetical protein
MEVEGPMIPYESPFPWLGFVFWVGLFSWLGIQAWVRYLGERDRQQTLRTYAERGTPPDKELMEKLFPVSGWPVHRSWRPSPQTTIRGLMVGGIVMLCGAIGLLIAAQIIGQTDYDALLGMSMGGVIALSIGLGLLTSSWALRRMSAIDAQKTAVNDSEQ